MHKSVALIGTAGLPPRYGGFETLADQLNANLKSQFNFTVYCSSRSSSDRIGTWNGAKLVYLPFAANGIQSIIYDFVSMIHALLRSEILVVMGVSGCLFLPVIRLAGAKKIIVNIDGLEWNRAKWSGWARLFLKLSEASAVRFAHAVISDNAEIQRYVKDRYGIESHLIEYGGDHVRTRTPQRAYKDDYPFLEHMYALTVCRIEPENNIDMILESFSLSPELPFVAVGNWNHSAFGRELRNKYQDHPQLHLFDPIYDQERLDVLRSSCSMYVHGHGAGGTNPSLVEAMYLGLPIVAYDVPFNRATTDNKALFFANSDDLKTTIRTFRSRNVDEIARDLHQVAVRRYRWNIIAEKYASLFSSS